MSRCNEKVEIFFSLRTRFTEQVFGGNDQSRDSKNPPLTRGNSLAD
jgi:hypothetical protein